MSDPRLAAGLRAAASKPCLLCGRRAYVGAVYAPDAASQRRVCAPPGKLRMVVYSLCRQCFRLPDKVRRAEDAIFAQVAADADRN